MENALVKVSAQDFGLQSTEAAKVEAVFLPMLAKMNELETEFNEIVSLPIEPTTIKKAKELRLRYVKIRTGTAEIHKGAKEYYRKGGLFVDAWKNAQAFASQGKEQKLEDIEKHFERLEAERKAKLKEERLIKLISLCDTPEMYPLESMSDAAFDHLLNGMKLAKQAKEDSERKAEEDRIAKEKADQEEQERIRLENERLKKEAEIAEIERKRQEQLLEEERAKAEKERKRAVEEKAAIEEAARKEREAIESKARKEKEAAEALAKAEKEKSMAAQRAIEEKARKEREELERKAKLAKEVQNRILNEQKAKSEAERKAAEKKAEIDRLEKEALQKKLDAMIECPNCKHKFSLESK